MENSQKILEEIEKESKLLSRIEEITIYPGMQRTIEVRYCPEKQDEIDTKVKIFLKNSCVTNFFFGKRLENYIEDILKFN